MTESKACKNILFVDDEPGILKALERELKKEDFVCFFAENGEKAWQIMENEVMAVVVTDLLMPGINGLELLEKVRKLYPLTVRIILSSVTDIKDILEAQRSGQTHRYLTKPWRTEAELLPMLYQSIDLYSLLVERADLWRKVIEQNDQLKKANQELKAYRELENQTRQRTSRHFSEFIKRNKAFLEAFEAIEVDSSKPNSPQIQELRGEAMELLSAMNMLRVFTGIYSD